MKIGLEVHVALPTRTKLFCPDPAYENTEEVNSNVCPVCLGLPGAKPVLNKKALEISAGIANALNCRINEKTWFIRKVYFYPDLPKGYQITQLDGSIGLNGYIEISGKHIRIRRVQIEEDPAKIIREKDYSLIDFNRSGIPLNEIVTEPDIETIGELRDFMEELRSILYYQGVDINQELKTDLNISLSDNRVEVKNVTGVNNLLSAAKYEIKRQESLLNEGKEIKRETRTYNEDSGETLSLREKETEEEYGFIFEPDLTFYSTKEIPLSEAIIPAKKTREIALRNGYSEKTIKELIYFDRRNLDILSGLKPDEFKKGVSLIEKFASFDMTDYTKDDFYRMIVFEFNQMDKQTFKSVAAGNPQVNEADRQEIKQFVKDMLADDPALLSRIKEDEKIINFLVGKIKKKYNLSAKESADLIKEVIKSLSVN
jgi:aspartyl-tRNA(Asn)/glutamyl-tRNA(Gln) amidotransferase subunit B